MRAARTIGNAPAKSPTAMIKTGGNEKLNGSWPATP
jgi:hypothetical protein